MEVVVISTVFINTVLQFVHFFSKLYNLNLHNSLVQFTFSTVYTLNVNCIIWVWYT